ncbi:MAG: amidase [Proteobacteria bacterium]|nr:amidase [Pseudomonadota bacterium]
MSDNLIYKGAVELAAMISTGDVSAEELTRAYIDRIEQCDGAINAVVVRTFERALQDARTADAAVARGDALGPLHGVPMTIKESYVMTDTPSTWGIPAYKDNISPTDGLAVQRFRTAGAHFLGKTNVPIDLGDFQSYNAIYGTTNNPWNLEHAPGGSSGGSAAALAAGFSALEAGSDIGGSIRTPAHFCGVFGHKPTWGIVPLQGHELFAGVPDADLSVCGPLARDAADLAVALDVMAGPEERSAAGWKLDLPRPRFKRLKGLRVAVWATDEMAPVSEETQARVHEVAEQLAGLGAVVSDTARPAFDTRAAHTTYQSLLTAVMSSAQPASVVRQMVEFAKRFGTDDDSAEAINARASVMMHRDWIRHNVRREKLRRAWDAFFRDWDILLCPQFSVPAIRHDHRPVAERTIDVDGEARPYGESLFWAGLVIASYLPSTVFPTGLSKAGLPIGLQAVGGPFQDYSTIEFARLVAQELGGFEAPPQTAFRK